MRINKMFEPEKTIEPSWNQLLSDEFSKPYYKKLKKILQNAYDEDVVYPTTENIFRAFELCPLSKVKLVILGQDPYHGENQSHGLCFSVPAGVSIPPSLRNIFKELYQDIGKTVPKSGNLEHWATQGVLMLNTILTVKAGRPGSHANIGWKLFSEEVINKLSTKRKQLVFLLWGKFAQSQEQFIAANEHYILKAAHPSPFSAHRGFFGCKHFSKANEFLKNTGQSAIIW